MPVFQSSSPAEILRAAEKDKSYVVKIQHELSSIVRKILGNTVLLKYKNTPLIASSLIYYGLTTLADNQTLGEEYTGLVQVDDSLRNLPSKTARVLAVLLQILGPHIVDKLLAIVEVKLRETEIDPSRVDLRDRIVRVVQLTRLVVNWAERFHLVLFYLLGKHYRLSQRIAGIQFVSLRTFSREGGYGKTFKIIGLIALLQLMVSLYLTSKNTVTEQDVLQENADTAKSALSGKKCALCLEVRKNTSCTPCGHLFCWNCILQWLQAKQECPLCREPLQPSRVVPLLNCD